MFVSERPDYMADWDWERNNAQGIKPDELTIASRKRVSWKCHVCGGQWDTTLKDRRGCPYCNKFKALPGYNDLATTHPDLASQWSYENNSLTPQDVTKGSQKKVFWRCEKGHVWDAQVNSRVAGQGCPFCNNRRILQGYNDLATTRPDIARDWDYSKNEGITPCNIIAGCKKKIWWKCHICGFEWETTVGNRNRGNGCPSCAHVRVHEGKNDLLSNYPVLSAEWDYDKNTIAPEQVAIYSRKRVAWICPKGHSYQAVVSDRVKGSRCPICSRERLVSFPEKALYYYISKDYKEVVANYRAPWLHKYELDIYLQDYKIGIEYDGVYGHSSTYGVARDCRKNQNCYENGVTLLRIREHGCPPTESTSIDYIIPEGESLNNTIFAALNLLDNLSGQEHNRDKESIDVERDSGEIYSLIDYSEKENSLQNKAPEIAAMWHPDKNGKLTPEYVSIMSSKVVWWIGKCGHTYVKKSGSLFEKRPDLIEEWDWECNGDIHPEKVTCGSTKKVHWICKQCGHKWSASVTSRCRDVGGGCPKCADKLRAQKRRKALLSRKESLVVTHPVLAEEWCTERNQELSPDACTAGSGKKVWWKCNKCGTEWEAVICERTRGRAACPGCKKNKGQ